MTQAAARPNRATLRPVAERATESSSQPPIASPMPYSSDQRQIPAEVAAHQRCEGRDPGARQCAALELHIDDADRGQGGCVPGVEREARDRREHRGQHGDDGDEPGRRPGRTGTTGVVHPMTPPLGTVPVRVLATRAGVNGLVRGGLLPQHRAAQLVGVRAHLLEDRRQVVFAGRPRVNRAMGTGS